MPKNILIIDDDPAIAKALEDELNFFDFETSTAKDGAAGLAQAKKGKPDLILLDIMMPKMNGMEVLEKLRDDAWGRSVPVILLTQLEPDDRIMDGIHRFEPALYLLKRDWTLKDVAHRVQEILSR